MMMYIFGSTTNTEYRTKLFDHWPTVSASNALLSIAQEHATLSVLGRFQ